MRSRALSRGLSVEPKGIQDSKRGSEGTLNNFSVVREQTSEAGQNSEQSGGVCVNEISVGGRTSATTERKKNSE